MSRLVRYVAVLTGVLLVAGVVLEERDASYQFRTTFGVKAPKTVADRIRLAPLVFRELERTVEEMATFCVASEAAANRPLRQGETEEARDRIIETFLLRAEIARQRAYSILDLAEKFRIPIWEDPARHRKMRIVPKKRAGRHAVGSLFLLTTTPALE